jgi:cob(I)alamin adenosyltransferase
MRITRVYTRGGDSGETSLVGGARVSKASPRVDSYGDVDELNSLLGLARAKLLDPEIDNSIGVIQNDLFTVSADLASPSTVEVPRVSESLVTALEAMSDHYNAELGPLKEFILPGGSEAGAVLHLARTVARRAERRAVGLAGLEDLNPQVIVYLNRLSDLLFILARAANRRGGVSEKLAEFSKKS